MQIQQILDKTGDRLITLPGTATLAQIAKVLSTEQIGTVMVTDEAARLIGILSERDLGGNGADDQGGEASIP